MKTLLVIGGTGFFGKSILDAFARGLLQPWDVTNIIVMSRNTQVLEQEAPQLITKNVTLLSADITTTDSLPCADFVIHAAASTDVRDYISRPESEKNNIQAGTYNYCELAKKFHRKSKIVYVSSGAVYGVQLPSIEELDELSKPHDLSNMDAGKRDYAVAKQDAELAITQLGFDGLNVSIARCFAFVGCWLPRDQHFAIGNFIGDVLNQRPIIVKAKHQVYRSYMYADDLVEWLMTIADHASIDCPTYNVGSDQAILVGDLAKELSQRYNVPAEVPLITEAKIDRYVPSIKKAKVELGLHLKHDLFPSIHETIRKIESVT
jgi:nucleoside-diphosphate-sugar epimerase